MNEYMRELAATELEKKYTHTHTKSIINHTCLMMTMMIIIIAI